MVAVSPVIVVTGPSGAGKGTLIRAILERIPELEVAISATTRPQRPGEENGREYWFLTDEEFTARVEEGAFLEWVEYVSDKRYGTLRSEIDRIATHGRVCVLELETDGALHVQAEVAGACTIFIAADVEELERQAARACDRVDRRDRRADRDRPPPARAGAPLPLHGAKRRSHAGERGARRDRRTGAGPRRYHASPMIEPRIDDLLSHTGSDTDPPSRYALVIMAAKRARQINNYHHQLGEGIGLEDAPPPLVESRSKNYLTMAMEEISRGKLTFSYTPPGP